MRPYNLAKTSCFRREHNYVAYLLEQHWVCANDALNSDSVGSLLNSLNCVYSQQRQSYKFLSLSISCMQSSSSNLHLFLPQTLWLTLSLF